MLADRRSTAYWRAALSMTSHAVSGGQKTLIGAQGILVPGGDWRVKGQPIHRSGAYRLGGRTVTLCNVALDLGGVTGIMFSAAKGCFVLINRVRIDSQFFYLEPAADVAGLKDQILDAARGVAQFVVFTPVGYGQVSVLMTPHTAVRFEEQQRTEEEVAGWEENPPATDHFLDYGMDF